MKLFFVFLSFAVVLLLSFLHPGTRDAVKGPPYQAFAVGQNSTDDQIVVRFIDQ